MAYIFTVANQKGGVAKTETSKMLGSLLRLKGYKILFIDSDPQCNLTRQLGSKIDHGIYRVLTGDSTIAGAAAAVEGFMKADSLPKAYLLSGSPMLPTLSNDALTTGINTLRAAIESDELAQSCDFIVIDTPPASSNSSLNSLVAADMLIVPTTADVDAIQGTMALCNTVNEINRRLGDRVVVVGGLLLTMFNKTRVNARRMFDLATKAAEMMDTKVFGSSIRPAEIVNTCKTMEYNLAEKYPNNPVTLDYLQFTNELLADLKRAGVLPK